MSIPEIQGKFLAGQCEQITDHLELKSCQELHARYKQSLRRARCKCKHKGIRASYLKQLEKLLIEN